ncbi:SRPBCC family protein [Kribbella sp. NBC_01510]|uniref:SRPBCC family protein n=1 Tax=Kribbella sp. NBC_01510 TaxID=2903581 RepID=UPI0038658F39
MADLTESIAVEASPADLYALVSDLSRMGEWSPECTHVTWSSHPPAPTGDTSVPPGAATGPAGRPGAGAGPSTTPGAVAGSSTAPGAGAGSSAAPWPTVGARFVGHNRIGAVRWLTFGRVVDADPGRRFAFSIHFGPIPISLWAYDFTPTATGCVVSESWTDHRPATLRLLFRPVFGNRTPRNAQGIHTTLTRLKSTAEAAATA